MTRIIRFFNDNFSPNIPVHTYKIKHKAIFNALKSESAI